MIVLLNCIYGRVLNVTYIGAMVEGIQKRLGNHPGIVYTISYIVTIAKHMGDPGKKWLSQFDVIVIDEGSNVDERLFAALLHAVPNASKLVIVGDLEQIYPIDPGCPFHDLVGAFGCVTFTTNHRADFRELSDACSHIVNNTVGAMQFDDTTVRQIPRGDYYSTLCNAIPPTVTDIMDFQMVTCRNDDRAKINEAIERIAIERGLLKKAKFVKLTNNVDLFPGKKIIFSKTHKESEGYDSVRNGEIVRVEGAYPLPSGEISIKTTSGKVLLVSKVAKDAILPFEVESAYCVTCNKAQGSQWKDVAFWLPASRFPFTREYPYVAFSRARQSFTLVGAHEELVDMCRYKASPRTTLLSRMLQPLKLSRTQKSLRLVPSCESKWGLADRPIAEPETPNMVPIFVSAPKKKKRQKIDVDDSNSEPKEFSDD